MLDHSVLRSFLNQFNFENPVFVTFTLKQCIRDHGPLSTDKMRRNFRHFSNRLNQKVFGNSFRRFGNRLNMIVVEEGGSNGVRLHQHTIIDRPDRVQFPEFCQMIENIWVNQTLWGYHQIYFDRPNTEFGGVEGWISYITKGHSKTLYLGDHIDWENCHFS